MAQPAEIASLVKSFRLSARTLSIGVLAAPQTEDLSPIMIGLESELDHSKRGAPLLTRRYSQPLKKLADPKPTAIVRMFNIISSDLSGF
jgi:hypothetical protein